MTSSCRGTIKQLFDKETFDSGFTKRGFVVESEGEYPQQIKIEFVKDRIALLDQYKIGDRVEVYFNIRGNEYNGNYFVNLQGWKLEVCSS